LSGIEAIVVLFIWAIPFLAIVFAVRLLLNISGSLTCISGALADIGRSLAKQVPRGD